MTNPNWLFDPNSDPRNTKGQIAWFGLWLAVTLIGTLYLEPSSAGHGTHTQLGLPKCYSVVMFDRPCPGCGLTTSWTATMHGNLPLAFSANALGPIIYSLFTLTALLALFGAIKKLRLRTETKLATGALVALIVTFLAYGVIRFTTVTYNDPSHLIYQNFRNADQAARPEKSR